MTLDPRLSAALADRYQISRELGRGGMATVYLAEDLKHHRKVAIKVLRPELSAVLGAERFVREIETTASLRHPHILPLFDSGNAGGFLFYVMPLVSGESLRARLDREGQLPLEDALRIAREVADGLAYAHAHGVVHRDLKPENILLESGHAVLADFGIARAVTEAGGQTLTETGIVVGTPTYMSPEQAAGTRQLDGRSDLYSLGCLIYEMLAGQPPFTGPTVQSIVHQHITVEPRLLTQIRPSVPAETAAVIQRALAKAPADRFASAGQLLEALVVTGPATARAAPTRQRYLVPITAGAVVLLAGFLFFRGRAPAGMELARRTQVTLDPGLELDPALSPDGKFIAYAGPQGVLMVRQVQDGTPIPLVREGDARGRWPVWTPDGQRIAFVSARGIEIVAALGGSPRLLHGAADRSRGLALSPDGKSYVYALHDSIFAAGIEGGAARLITTGREVHSFAWSPDNRWIAFVSGNAQYVSLNDLGNIAPTSVWIAPITGGAAKRVTDEEYLNVSPAWTPEGGLLYISTRDGGREAYQLRLKRSGEPAGAPERLTTGLSAYAISMAANGSRFAFASFNEISNVWSAPIPATGSISVSQAVPVTIGNQIIENIGVSRDGRWIAFSSDRSGGSQIYRLKLGSSGAQPQALTSDSTDSYWADWSPDDREIAFHRFLGGRRQIFIVSADGSTQIQVTAGSDDERSPDWSPDGKHLIMIANWGVHPALHIVTRGSDGKWSAPKPFTIVIGSDTIGTRIGSWSPDGQSIACGCGPGGIVIAPVSGGPARRLASPFPTDGWAFPQWSDDGRIVYHIVEDSGRTTGVAAVPVSGAAPRIVLRFDDPTRPWHRFGFRVRGPRLYFNLGDQESDIWVAEVGPKK